MASTLNRALAHRAFVRPNAPRVESPITLREATALSCDIAQGGRPACATAAAVGERLKRLADQVQVLVITHSPQVAALGAQHWRVEKRIAKGVTSTDVATLAAAARREEIARMLSGATISDEARAAADKLLKGAA